MRAVGLVIALATAACAVGPRAASAVDAAVTLYRDQALVEEHLAVELDDAGVGRLPLVGDLATVELEVIAAPGAIVAWTRRTPAAGDPIEVAVGDGVIRGRLIGRSAAGVEVATDDGVVVADAAIATSPLAVLEVRGRGRGRLPITVRYQTDRLRWDAAYTLLARGGGHALTGALLLDNRTGRTWSRAALAVIDASLADDEPAERWSRTHPLALGASRAIGPGQQRIELALGRAPIQVAATLTYAPMSPRLNRDDMVARADYPDERPTTTVDATVAVQLPRADAWPLPRGPVRMIAVEPDGGPRWQGEVMLPSATADGPRTVALPLGRVPDLSGTRTQSMFALDAARERMVEEFRITLANRGTRPATVQVREQLYRGPCWRLAYYSTREAAREAPQQVRMVTDVPAGGSATVVYRVVYKLGPCPSS